MADAVATRPLTAPARVLSAWSDESVKVAEVLDALAALRWPAGATRTRVLTLVIVSHHRDQASRAQAAIHELGGRHPARVLTLIVEPAAAGEAHGLDAELRLFGGVAEGREVWFEEIELRVRGRVAEHLDSLIEPFTLPDLPVVCWFVDELPEVDDPLLAATDVLLVDARHFGGPACFRVLAELTATRTVVDLSWTRLAPWRELLAGLFEGPDFRPFVAHVEHAEVWGRTGPRHLLAGWLSDRLDLPAAGLTLSPAEHVGIRLHSRPPSGPSAVFEVIRGDARVVAAKAEVVDGPSLNTVLQLPEATPSWGLTEALSRLERDPVYERALRRALPD